METMNILNAYKLVATNQSLPQMTGATLHRQTTTHANAQSLWEALAACGPTQGWLQFQSRQFAFFDGLPESLPEWGVLLAAEAFTTDGDSVNVSLGPSGTWLLLRSHHAAGTELLCDEITLLAHGPETGALHYRRYWMNDPTQGFVQVAACFLGFEKE